MPLPDRLTEFEGAAKFSFCTNRVSAESVQISVLETEYNIAAPPHFYREEYILQNLEISLQLSAFISIGGVQHILCQPA